MPWRRYSLPGKMIKPIKPLFLYGVDSMEFSRCCRIQNLDLLPLNRLMIYQMRWLEPSLSGFGIKSKFPAPNKLIIRAPTDPKSGCTQPPTRHPRTCCTGVRYKIYRASGPKGNRLVQRKALFWDTKIANGVFNCRALFAPNTSVIPDLIRDPSVDLCVFDA